LPSRTKTQTRLGLISDIHGDFAALRDALAQLKRLNVTKVLCAGDLLDWGPSPVRCIELLHELRIPCVRGNHDLIEPGGPDLDVPNFLSPKAAAFIDSLPHARAQTIVGIRVAVWHASPGDLMRGIHADRAQDVDAILASAAADVLIVGHTHVPLHLSAPGGAIVNPGSILRRSPPSEKIPASGTFGVLELPSRRFTVHRASDGAVVMPAD
jgi:putative phosphoesterase